MALAVVTLLSHKLRPLPGISSRRTPAATCAVPRGRLRRNRSRRVDTVKVDCYLSASVPSGRRDRKDAGRIVRAEPVTRGPGFAAWPDRWFDRRSPDTEVA